MGVCVCVIKTEKGKICREIFGVEMFLPFKNKFKNKYSNIFLYSLISLFKDVSTF